MSGYIVALLLLAQVPVWKAAGEDPPWVCGRQLRASGFEKWQHTGDLLAAGETLLATPRGQRAWSEGMNGRPGEDLLGRKLPAFVTRARALAWTEHPRPDSVDLVTARRWPGVVGERWIVLAAGKSGPAGTPAAELMDVRLALVEVTGTDPEPSVRRLARTTSSIVPCADWGALPEKFRPTQMDEAPCGKAGMDAGFEHTGLTALDFAPYRLTPSERAFGLRTTMSEGYAGGFATFETLTLFRVDGEALLPILDVPTGVVKMLAGNWNKEGTRQHETVQADLVVDVHARGANMADLLLRSRPARQGLVFSWSRERQAYGCGR